jgi:hypothetical protein
LWQTTAVKQTLYSALVVAVVVANGAVHQSSVDEAFFRLFGTLMMCINAPTQSDERCRAPGEQQQHHKAEPGFADFSDRRSAWRVHIGIADYAGIMSTSSSGAHPY